MEGAGKSTLMKIVTTASAFPDEVRAFVEFIDVQEGQKECSRKGIGYLS